MTTVLKGQAATALHFFLLPASRPCRTTIFQEVEHPEMTS